MDLHSVGETDYRFLLDLASRFKKSDAALLQMEDGMSLRMVNYVGVVQLPGGDVLEILPKHMAAPVDAEAARSLLIKMLGVVTTEKPRASTLADIRLLKRPIHEWVMARFLDEMDLLMKRGLKFEYREIDEEKAFVRGRIDVVRQMRQSPGRMHLVHVRHEEFMPDCPENRLLRSALRRIRLATRDEGNWRLANELSTRTEEIPESTHWMLDFKRWRTGRLLSHYAAVRPWCELVLGMMMPMAQRGIWEGWSMLFPMEVLFEKYVAARLQQGLRPGCELVRQSTKYFLCEHDQGWIFQLKPDLLVRGAAGCWVLDTKWKLLDSSRKGEKYLIDEADVYQMLAYGQRYLEGSGELLLVYPRTERFREALPRFRMGAGLRLQVVPFDLDEDRLLVESVFLTGDDAADFSA